MNSPVESFRIGDWIYEKPDYLWLIIDGVVKSYTINTAGKTVILGFWGKQEIVGKSLSSIDPYFLQCSTKVEAISIHMSQARVFSDMLLNRVEQIQQLSYIIREPQTKNRLWLLLKWLADKFGREVAEGKLIDFELATQELADSIGIDRIEANQTIELLKQEGAISRFKSQYIVLEH